MRPAGRGASGRMLALPVAFEADRGQLARGTAFIARGLGWHLALGRDGMTLGPVRMTLAGAHPAPPRGAGALRGKTSYLTASGKRWGTHIPLYGRVVYRHAWPGVDVAFHATQGRPEYDLVLHRGADVHAVAFRFAGPRPQLDAHGDLNAGPLREPRPRVRREGRPVTVRYTVVGDRVGVRLTPHA